MPDGVLNIVHGAHETVNFICDAPEIKVSHNTIVLPVHN